MVVPELNKVCAMLLPEPLEAPVIVEGDVTVHEKVASSKLLDISISVASLLQM